MLNTNLSDLPIPSNSGEKFSRVCLTPTRNESWIITPFLAAAKRWATHVIVADQGSIDGTKDIIAHKSGVELIHNDSPTYEENYRQKLLLERARCIDGKRILLGLDADEALSSNSIKSPDWDKIEAATPGTILRFRWVNILPGFQKAWIPPNLIPLGFVDDGSPHIGTKIHSPRVPMPHGAPVLDLTDIVVLHFQYVLWERVESKQRWYQAWEHLNHRALGPLQIFRQYNHMYGSWEKNEIQDVKPEWLEAYDSAGIDFRSLKAENITWWDRDLLRLLQEHGPESLRKCNIWGKDWTQLAADCGYPGLSLHDPRTIKEKLAHTILRGTQGHRSNWFVRAFEHLLRRSGW